MGIPAVPRRGLQHVREHAGEMLVMVGVVAVVAVHLLGARSAEQRLPSRALLASESGAGLAIGTGPRHGIRIGADSLHTPTPWSGISRTPDESCRICGSPCDTSRKPDLQMGAGAVSDARHERGGRFGRQVPFRSPNAGTHARTHLCACPGPFALAFQSRMAWKLAPDPTAPTT